MTLSKEITNTLFAMKLTSCLIDEPERLVISGAAENKEGHI